MNTRTLIESILKNALVDSPDQVQVNEVMTGNMTIFEVRVAASDLGKVIGRQGRMAKSIRTILASIGGKERRCYSLEILQ